MLSLNSPASSVHFSPQVSPNENTLLSLTSLFSLSVSHPFSSLSVLGLVPVECQCRDLELDCNGAHFKDVPTVSTNVTMMWVPLHRAHQVHLNGVRARVVVLFGCSSGREDVSSLHERSRHCRLLNRCLLAEAWFRANTGFVKVWYTFSVN